jgi:hypothetical protein
MTQSIGQCHLKLSRGNGYSKGQADHIARAMCLRGKQVEAYLCDYCGLWHVGRRFKKTPKRGERVADLTVTELTPAVLAELKQLHAAVKEPAYEDLYAAWGALPKLIAEVERLRGEVHDCPACGMACKQCRCYEAEMDRLRQEIDRLTGSAEAT